MLTHLMIKKTMTITSLAILVAAISVATTMTIVQATPEPTPKATFGLTPLGFANPLAGGDITNHEYSHVAASKALTVTFTNPASLPGGFFDAVEPGFQGAPFTAPVPDASITLYLAGVPVTTPFNIVEGYEEATFTMAALNPGQNYFLGTIIFDMDDFGLTTDMAGTMPAPETVFVSVNGVDLPAPVTAVPGGGPTQVITTAHGVVKATPAANIVVGFNELFIWDPVGVVPLALPVCGNAGFPLPCIGLQSGIRVEQIELILASQSTGFWKNHEDVVDTLTTGMLIDLLGDGTILINDDAGVDSDDIFQATKKTKGDARPQLAAQLLAAQLNVKNGAVSCMDATDAIAAAQAALIALSYDGLGGGIKPTGDTTPSKSDVNAIKNDLDDYNNNLLCPAP